MSALERKAIEHVWDIVTDLQVEIQKDEGMKKALESDIMEARAWLEALMQKEDK